jgi:protein-histidine N-methyltransferase
LSIPLSSGAHVVLARRDLFDARFQLIAGDESDAIGETVGGTDVKEPRNVQSALEFLDSPSDLVPGLYEGGLKTWECSLDLVDCLDSFQKSQGICMDIRGKRVLEVRLSGQLLHS